MPRVDIWDVQAAKEEQAIDCGYARNFSDKFQVLYQIGKGGFGVVRCVKDVLNGDEFACKSIRKKLDVPNLSVDKQAKHIDNIKREISILRKLRGTLSVVYFKGAYEDDEFIHIVMEYCRGGELHHRIGKRQYTEQTVQRIMRACMQTLAQCHSHHILHRDIKPGNFMFLNENEDSPVKALDFGLAVYFNPNELPRSDLGLEGTPWFMSPESLQSAVVPATDVWAGGVMAYQLLTGYLPFDDRRNPKSPALSLVWRAILTDEPKMTGSLWSDISEDARDFVKTLLNKDPEKRPSAKECLNHRWLSQSEEQLPCRELSHTVVQRIQRFNQSNLVRRSILDMIAAELIEYIRINSPDPSVHGTRMSNGSLHSTQRSSQDSLVSPGGDGGLPSPMDISAHGKAPRMPAVMSTGAIPNLPPSPKASSMHVHFKLPEDEQRDGTRGSDDMDVDGRASPMDEAELKFKHEMEEKMTRKVNSVHGGSEFLKMRKSASHAALADAMSQKAHSHHGARNYFRIMRAAAALINPGSHHGSTNYIRLASRNDDERTEQAKVARIGLDTSAHGGKEFHHIVKQLSGHPNQLDHIDVHALLPKTSAKHLAATVSERPAVRFPPASPEGSQEGKKVAKVATESLEVGRRGQGAFKAFLQSAGEDVPAAAAEPKEASKPAAPAVLHDLRESSSLGAERSTDSATAKTTEDLRASSKELLEMLSRSSHGSVTHPKQLRPVLEQMKLERSGSSITAQELGEGLERLGYQLEDSELNALVDQLDLDGDGHIEHSQFVASQIDWTTLQEDYRDMWLECARRAFAKLDESHSGKIDADALMTVMKTKLPSEEVDWAIEDALMERGYADADEMDFDAFLRLVKSTSYDSLDSLDQYESRIEHNYHPQLDTIADDDDDDK